MTSRKALLIGAAEYGEGFARLPAVRNDVRTLAEALAAAGYETEVCSDDVVSNAGQLDSAMRSFCRSGTADDVRLIYFSGHGMRLEGADWLVPAGTNRRDALDSQQRRVSTDLSTTVADSAVGLVVFVVDACRDPSDAPVAKGAAGFWADLKRPAEVRFVRFLGCAPDEVCQVIGSAADGSAVSVFTAALAGALTEQGCASLEAVRGEVERRCAATLAANPQLRSQTPLLNYGELSSAKTAVLQRPIFDPVGPHALASVWEKFEPNKLHCLVLTSEYEAEKAPSWGLLELVNDALSGETGDRIWNTFRAAWGGLVLTGGTQRSLPLAFSAEASVQASFSVLEAFASWETLERAVRAVVEADLVVFDVTGFEPGVMVLLGIRAACRRSMTICSHGAGWREGKPLELPFNLQDLNINSHTPRETRIGADPVVERFVQRVEIGFRQLARHPAYLDLPGYDELRQLGSDYEASKTIDVGERVLVLCSFRESFFEHWQYLQAGLKAQLWRRNQIRPEIERIIDYGTPQLVRQGLYEQVRRGAACVVDWSELRASVFLELGARLAVSEWGAVQMIDEQWLPGAKNASSLAQLARIARLFEPIPYSLRSKATGAFEKAASALLDRNPGADSDAPYNRVHRALLPIVGGVQQAALPVAEDLRRRADALHHPGQARKGAPQALFFGNRATKVDNERAALEMRIAAWLYLEHRIGPTRRHADPALQALYREVGTAALGALYELDDEASFALAELIEKQIDL
ncbi:MAG: caspase family protein [Vicinamibacteraceae bacterium]